MMGKEAQNDGKRSAEWLGKEAQDEGRGIEKKGGKYREDRKKVDKSIQK